MSYIKKKKNIKINYPVYILYYVIKLNFVVKHILGIILKQKRLNMGFDHRAKRIIIIIIYSE